MRSLTRRLHEELGRGAVSIRRDPALTSLVNHYARTNRLTAVLPATYTTVDPTDEALLAAVHLWDPDAIIYGTAAAILTSMTAQHLAVIEIASKRRPTNHHPKYRISARHIPPEWILNGATVPAMTAVDLAATDNGDALCTALRANGVCHDDLLDAFDAVRGRRGDTTRRRIIAAAAAEPWSVAELELHTLLVAAGITGWQANHPVRVSGANYFIDVAFPGRKLAIEVDGYEFHAQRHQFEADANRHNAITVRGWTVLRFTWRDITENPASVIATISRVLSDDQ